MTESESPRTDMVTPSGLEMAIRDLAENIATLIRINKADNDRADVRAQKADERAQKADQRAEAAEARASRTSYMLGAATVLLAVGTGGIAYTSCVVSENTIRVGEMASVVATLAEETRLAKEGVTEATEQAKEIAAAAPRVEVVTPATSASSGKAAKAPQLAVVIPARTATPKTSGSPAAAAAPAVTVLIPTPSAIVTPGPAEAPSKAAE